MNRRSRTAAMAIAADLPRPLIRCCRTTFSPLRGAKGPAYVSRDCCDLAQKRRSSGASSALRKNRRVRAFVERSLLRWGAGRGRRAGSGACDRGPARRASAGARRRQSRRASEPAGALVAGDSSAAPPFCARSQQSRALHAGPFAPRSGEKSLAGAFNRVQLAFLRQHQPSLRPAQRGEGIACAFTRVQPCILATAPASLRPAPAGRRWCGSTG